MPLRVTFRKTGSHINLINKMYKLTFTYRRPADNHLHSKILGYQKSKAGKSLVGPFHNVGAATEKALFHIVTSWTRRSLGRHQILCV